MPKQFGVMRPCSVTAVASIMNTPAPLLSKLAQCIKCQSLALPSKWQAYWHMGATTMRLGKVNGPSGELSVMGVKRRLMGFQMVFGVFILN
jgi:hypothetical protein